LRGLTITYMTSPAWNVHRTLLVGACSSRITSIFLNYMTANAKTHQGFN
jgi:hypothetical protein